MEEILEPEIKEAIGRWTKINRENASQVIEELSQYRECIQAKKSLREVDINYVGRFYYNLAYAYHYKDIETTISILKEGYEYLKQKMEHHIDENFVRMFGELLLYSVNSKQIKEALELTCDYAHYGFSKERSYDSIELYSFYPVKEYHIKDLRDYKISLSDPREFNDPADCPFFQWAEYLQFAETTRNPTMLEMLSIAYSNIRIRCFTRDRHNLNSSDLIPGFCNTLMWSHYADSHKGYCVKYRFPNGFFYKEKEGSVLLVHDVIYRSKMSILKESLTIEDGFFTKHESWGYEDEVRMLYYNLENPPKFNKIQMWKGTITDVYFGVNCREEDMKKIIDALKNEKVQYHNMNFDPQNLYLLKNEPWTPEQLEKF